MVPIIPISIFLLFTAITGTLTRVLPWLPDCSGSGDVPYPGHLPVRPWPIWIRNVSLPDIIVERTTARPLQPRPLPIDPEIVIDVSQLVVNEDGLEKAAAHAIELLREQKEIGDRIAAELNHAVRADKLLKISKELAKEGNPPVLNYSILSSEVIEQGNEKILLNIIDLLLDYLPKNYWIQELQSSKVVQVSAGSDFPTQVTWLKNDQLRTNKQLSDIQREHGVQNTLQTYRFPDNEEATVLDRSVKLAAAYAKELKFPVQLYPLARIHPLFNRKNSVEHGPLPQIAFVLSELSPLNIAYPPLSPFAVLVVDQ